MIFQNDMGQSPDISIEEENMRQSNKYLGPKKPGLDRKNIQIIDNESNITVTYRNSRNRSCNSANSFQTFSAKLKLCMTRSRFNNRKTA